MKQILSTVKQAALLLGCGAALVSADNLLMNGSFEQGGTGWQQWGAVATEHSYAGAKAMQVKNRKAQWSGISQMVPILKGTTKITLSGWMKTDDVTVGNSFWEAAQMTIAFADENGTEYEYYPEQTALVSGNSEWTHYERSYTIFNNAAQVKVLAALGNCTGSASYDKLSLTQFRSDGSVQKQSDLLTTRKAEERAQKEAPTALKNGDFSDGTNSWKVYQGSSTDGYKGKGIHFSNGKTEWSGASQNLAIPAKAAAIVVSGRLKTEKVIRGKEGWDKAVINFEFHNDAGERLGEHPSSIVEVEGSTDWHYYQKRYAVLAGSSQVKLFAQLCNAKGKAWFDDLKVVFYDKNGTVVK